MLQISSILILFNIFMLGNLQREKHQPDWLTLSQLNEKMLQQPKPILLFIHTDWCAYCRKMLNETFADPSVLKKLRENYYCVSFDAESTESFTFYGKRYTNHFSKKRKGSFHSFANHFLEKAGSNNFPTTMILSENLEVQRTQSIYLSINDLMNFL